MRAADDLVDVANLLNCLAGVAAVGGHPRPAARLFGAADGTAAAHPIIIPAQPRVETERDVVLARSQFDEAVFKTSWSHGRGLTLEQA